MSPPTPRWTPTQHQLLLDHYKSDEAIDQALLEARVEDLVEIPGIGLQTALRLVRDRLDRHPPEVAKEDAKRLLDDLTDRLLAQAATKFARNQLRVRPWPANAEAAQAACEEVVSLSKFLQAYDTLETRRKLTALQRPIQPTPRRNAAVVVVCENPNHVKSFETKGLDRWYAIYGPRDMELALQHDAILLVAEDGRIDAGGQSNVIEIPSAKEAMESLPGPMLAYVERNAPLLDALVGMDVPEAYGRANLEALAKLLQDRPPATVRSWSSREVRQEVEAAAKAATAAIEGDLAELQIGALEVLRAQQSGGLPLQLKNAVAKRVSEGHKQLQQTFGMPCDVLESGLPITVDSEGLVQLQEKLQQQALSRLVEDQLAWAKRAKQLPQLVLRAFDDLVRFDHDLALTRFVTTFDLHAPKIGDRIELRQAARLDLRTLEQVQKIDYHLGEEEPVILLTGANSGGKSTLLELLAQCILLLRMGLPGPYDAATLPWLEEVHLIKPKRGIDAGAFETFLRSFLPLASSSGSRLILVDEVEAVTELEAASKILAHVIRKLHEHRQLSVVVTHLAPQLLPVLAPGTVRVDGIQAKGLDERNQLVVDRAPQIGVLARSTPELILQRLVREGDPILAANCSEILESLERDLQATRTPGT